MGIQLSHFAVGLFLLILVNDIQDGFTSESLLSFAA